MYDLRFYILHDLNKHVGSHISQSVMAMRFELIQQQVCVFLSIKTKNYLK